LPAGDPSSLFENIEGLWKYLRNQDLEYVKPRDVWRIDIVLEAEIKLRKIQSTPRKLEILHVALILEVCFRSS